jgi:hypothetical protein
MPRGENTASGKQGFLRVPTRPAAPPRAPRSPNSRRRAAADTASSTAVAGPVDAAHQAYQRLASAAPAVPPEMLERRPVPGRGGMFQVNVNEIDEETRQAYLAGQCYALAGALADRQQSQVGLLVRTRNINVPWGTRADDPAFAPPQGGAWLGETLHAVALPAAGPDGADPCSLDQPAVDIDGQITLADRRADFERRWGEPVTLVVISPHHLRQVVRDSRQVVFAQDDDTAALVAALVLQQAGAPG